MTLNDTVWCGCRCCVRGRWWNCPSSSSAAHQSVWCDGQHVH